MLQEARTQQLGSESEADRKASKPDVIVCQVTDHSVLLQNAAFSSLHSQEAAAQSKSGSPTAGGTEVLGAHGFEALTSKP